MLNNIIYNIVKLIVPILIFSLFLFYTPLVARAYFSEDFNLGFTNISAWQQVNGQGISFTDQGMSLQASSPVNFPFIYSKNEIISNEDNFIEFKFNYIDVGGNFGDGIAITDVNPIPGITMLYPDTFSRYTMFYVWQGPGYPYLHIVTFLCPISNPNCSGEPSIIFNSESTDYGVHTIRIEIVDGRYILYVDGNKYFESSFSPRVAKNIWIGHPETTTTPGTWAKFFIDYIHVGAVIPSPSPTVSPTTTPSTTPSPTSTPTPTPTLTPTPSPTPTSKAFPYYSQSDSRWGKEIYDHAQSWAERGKQSIDRWGCALTSATMVLKNYGVKTKNGSETTPANLNSWLKSQPDGYLSNGLVNWLAITRYVHESKLSGKSPTELEFVKSKYDQINTESQLNNGKFPILGIPGHFVVATENSGTSYKINDPADKNKQNILKTENIITSNTFYPSMTDLSYIFMAYDPNLTLKITDSHGQSITGITSEEYLSDDKSGQTGKHEKLLYLPKPKNGDYLVEVLNDTDRKARLDVYFYNKTGQVWSKKLEIFEETDTQFNFHYDNEKILKNKIEHNWKWVWQYIRKWRRWERVWDLRKRWSIGD